MTVTDTWQAMMEGHQSCPVVYQGGFRWGFFGHAALVGGAAAVQIDYQT